MTWIATDEKNSMLRHLTNVCYPI